MRSGEYRGGGAVIIASMSLTDHLLRPGRRGRLPASLDELHGPTQGVVVLPRHLAWPGLREFDIADDRLRRSLYGIVLTQGRRIDVARFVNARLLRQDWPQLRTSLDPRIRKGWERRLALGTPPPARGGRQAEDGAGG